jgi:UDP-glucose 4-epimerase
LRYLIVGGAGFIGSYIAEYVIELNITTEVIIYDNFTSGKMWHYGCTEGFRDACKY